MLIYRPLVIRQLRKRRGVSGEDLAAEAGVSVRAIRHLESGSIPRADTLGKIASALKVRVGVFYRDVDKEESRG